MNIDKNAISYRQINRDEISILVKYRILFLKELQGEQSGTTEKALRNQLTDYFNSAMKDGAFIALIAEFENQAIGFGGMVIQQIPGNFNLIDGKQGYILNMYTVPEFRKNGICSELLNQLIIEGKNLGLKKFSLRASNDGIGLYKRKRFSEPELLELIPGA